jgi:hypothetical protein
MTDEEKKIRRDKAIDLVRKLLALSNSPNENEAETAMAKAQRILTQYNLDLNEITDLDPSCADMSREYVMGSKSMWQFNLCATICKFNYCKCVRHAGYYGHHVEYAILGRSINVGVVMEMYNWILPQLVRLSEDALRLCPYGVHGKTYRNSFLFGCVSGIKERLKVQNEANLCELPKTQALIVCYETENTAFEESLYPKLHKIKMSNNIHYNAYNAGKAASKNVSLSIQRQVENSPKLK